MVTMMHPPRQWCRTDGGFVLIVGVIRPSGSIPGMARGKVTITLDRDKADKAMRLSGRQTVSGVIDAALDEYIRAERTRRDVEAYQRMPVTDDELRTIDLGGKSGLGDDDVDYAALYGFTTPDADEPA
jgi:Bacterial antitoxin of type II TA system, VapB